MAETKPIPVRLDEQVIARLDRAAKGIGTNRAALIRFLVMTFLDQWERHGEAALPHDWQAIMRSLDGRTYGQEKRFEALRADEDPPAEPGQTQGHSQSQSGSSEK